MLRNILYLFVLFWGCFSATTFAGEAPRVLIKTDAGSFIIELYPKEAPATVQNFLSYVDNKFYDGTIFHRVVPGFVVQGGGMTFDFAEKKTNKAIKNESLNGLRNTYKTVAMARHTDPHSATSQFYINLQANPGLDATKTKPGYAVFGKVIHGMEIIEKIAQEPRGLFKAHPEAPNYAIRILSAVRTGGRILEQPATSQSSQASRIRDTLVIEP